MLDCCLLAVKGFLKRTFANALINPLWTPLLLKDLFEEKVYKCLFNPLNLPVLVDFGK